MTIVRAAKQITTGAGTVGFIWDYNPARIKGMIVVVTAAANTYIGPFEGLASTTGMFVPVGVPIYFGPGGLDPTNSLGYVETTGTKVITVYEELSDNPEVDSE